MLVNVGNAALLQDKIAIKLKAKGNSDCTLQRFKAVAVACSDFKITGISMVTHRQVHAHPCPCVNFLIGPKGYLFFIKLKLDMKQKSSLGSIVLQNKCFGYFTVAFISTITTTHT